MNYWIRRANIKNYDFFAAFKENEVIDWTSLNHYQMGDIVYIYASKPYDYVSHKCEVVGVNITKSESIEDSEYWSSQSELKKGARMFVRLKLVKTFEKHVDLDDLGLTFLRSPIKLNEKQVRVIEEK